MNLPDELRRLAARLAGEQQGRRVELHAEIARLDIRGPAPEDPTRLASLKDDAENCAQSLIRFAAYKPEKDREPGCPYCWVIKGEYSPVEAASGSDVQLYRCPKCEAEYEQAAD